MPVQGCRRSTAPPVRARGSVPRSAAADAAGGACSSAGPAAPLGRPSAAARDDAARRPARRAGAKGTGWSRGAVGYSGTGAVGRPQSLANRLAPGGESAAGLWVGAANAAGPEATLRAPDRRGTPAALPPEAGSRDGALQPRGLCVTQGGASQPLRSCMPPQRGLRTRDSPRPQGIGGLRLPKPAAGGGGSLCGSFSTVLHTLTATRRQWTPPQTLLHVSGPGRTRRQGRAAGRLGRALSHVGLPRTYSPLLQPG